MPTVVSPGFVGPTPAQLAEERKQRQLQAAQLASSTLQQTAQRRQEDFQFRMANLLKDPAVTGPDGMGMRGLLNTNEGRALAESYLGPYTKQLSDAPGGLQGLFDATMSKTRREGPLVQGQEVMASTSQLMNAAANQAITQKIIPSQAFAPTSEAPEVSALPTNWTAGDVAPLPVAPRVAPKLAQTGIPMRTIQEAPVAPTQTSAPRFEIHPGMENGAPTFWLVDRTKGGENYRGDTDAIIKFKNVREAQEYALKMGETAALPGGETLPAATKAVASSTVSPTVPQSNYEAWIASQTPQAPTLLPPERAPANQALLKQALATTPPIVAPRTNAPTEVAPIRPPVVGPATPAPVAATNIPIRQVQTEVAPSALANVPANVTEYERTVMTNPSYQGTPEYRRVSLKLQNEFAREQQQLAIDARRAMASTSVGLSTKETERVTMRDTATEVAIKKEVLAKKQAQESLVRQAQVGIKRVWSQDPEAAKSSMEKAIYAQSASIMNMFDPGTGGLADNPLLAKYALNYDKQAYEKGEAEKNYLIAQTARLSNMTDLEQAELAWKMSASAASSTIDAMAQANEAFKAMKDVYDVKWGSRIDELAKKKSPVDASRELSKDPEFVADNLMLSKALASVFADGTSIRHDVETYGGFLGLWQQKREINRLEPGTGVPGTVAPSATTTPSADARTEAIKADILRRLIGAP